jgi:hypothetical protein
MILRNRGWSRNSSPFRRVHKISKSDYQLRHVLSVCKGKLGCHWTDFHEILYSSIFRKSVQKIQVSLKSCKNEGYFTLRPLYIYDNISLNSSYNKKCFRRSPTEYQNTHFMFSNFSISENLAVYEIQECGKIF